jgi:hypothetical protein
MKLILTGLTEKQKQDEIRKYVKKNGVKSVIVFSPKKFYLDLPDLGDIPIRQIEYNEVIMYRTFYPLLEEIGKDHLLVINEFLRTANRNDLTYNCLRHYLNQCGHQIIFEYFPFITGPEDFMILLDFDTGSKYKGSGFDVETLHKSNVRCVNHHITLDIQTVKLPEGAEEEYNNKKEELFSSVGKHDPDIIPRKLHNFCGKWKKPYIRQDLYYVARNARYGLPNVITYPHVKDGGRYVILDFQHRRISMNDFLKKTQQPQLVFLSTGLSIDNYYIKEFKAWLERLEEFYAEAGVYSQNS